MTYSKLLVISFTCKKHENCPEGKPNGNLEPCVATGEVVWKTVSLDQIKQRWLQEVHGHVELEHVRGKDGIRKVQLHNDEDSKATENE